MLPCFVYMLTSPPGMSYIGVAYFVLTRFKEHSKAASAIGAAVREFGKDNFVLKVLLCGPRDYCYEMEEKLVRAYGTRVPFGYNVASGGNGGRDHLPETVEKMSKAQQKRYAREEERKKARAGTTNYFESNPLARSKQGESQRRRFARPDEREKARRGTLNYFSDPAAVQRHSEIQQKRYEDPEQRRLAVTNMKAYYEAMGDTPTETELERRRKIGEATKMRLSDPDYCEKWLASVRQSSAPDTPAQIEAKRDRANAQWADSVARERLIKGMKKT